MGKIKAKLAACRFKGILVIAIVFGCYVYTSNNTVAALALANWPERIMAGEIKDGKTQTALLKAYLYLNQ